MKFNSKFFKIIKQTIKEFFEDRVFKMSASLTYYALFSLSPLLLILISAASIFFKKDAIENRLFTELNNVVGHDVAMAIQNFVTNSTVSGESSMALYIGIGVLIFGSTTMFADMQDSLNLIWRVEAEPKRAWLKVIINRTVSFLIILLLGLILVATIILSSVFTQFGQDISDYLSLNSFFSSATFVLINNGLSLVISVVVFFFLFKIFPDAKVKSKYAFIGAIFTAILFFISKYFIGIYISNSRYSAIFGSAASLVVLLLWIYYVASILYLGAKFTKVIAEVNGYPVLPTADSRYRVVSFKKRR